MYYFLLGFWNGFREYCEKELRASDDLLSTLVTKFLDYIFST